MLIKAYQLADNAQKAELDKWMTATEFQEAEKIAAVTHIYNIVGIGQHVQKKIEELFSQALACLEKVKVNSHQKDGTSPLGRPTSRTPILIRAAQV